MSTVVHTYTYYTVAIGRGEAMYYTDTHMYIHT